MGVFGKKESVATKPVAKAGRDVVNTTKSSSGNKSKPLPAMTLRVKAVGMEKSEYLTGLFIDDKQPEAGQKLSGKDKEGNRFTVFINEDGNGNLYYTPAESKEAVKLTGLFASEGKFGPYLGGKSKDGDRFYVAEAKAKEA
jgi:hypothetical protein